MTNISLLDYQKINEQLENTNENLFNGLIKWHNMKILLKK